MYENSGFWDLGVRSSFIKTKNERFVHLKHYYEVHKFKVFSVSTMTENFSKCSLVSKLMVIKVIYVLRV